MTSGPRCDDRTYLTWTMTKNGTDVFHSSKGAQEMSLKPRDTQTQVKHLILDQYLNAWGGIILHSQARLGGKAPRAGATKNTNGHE